MKKKILFIISIMMSIGIFLSCAKKDTDISTSVQEEEKDTENEDNAQQEENHDKDNINNEEQEKKYEELYKEKLTFAKVEEGNFGSYSVKKQTYSFDNGRGTKIIINYPLVNIKNNKELSDKITQTIKKAAFGSYNKEEIENEYNINITVNYTIVYHSKDIISIYFDGEWFNHSFEKGLAVSLKDGTMKKFESSGITKETLQDLLKTKNIALTTPGIIDFIKEIHENIPDYFYDNYINDNDEECNFFMDENNIYIVALVPPVCGNEITLRIPYKCKTQS